RSWSSASRSASASPSLGRPREPTNDERPTTNAPKTSSIVRRPSLVVRRWSLVNHPSPEVRVNPDPREHVTLLVAEGDGLLRSLLAETLGREDGIAVVGSAADGHAAWEAACRL